MGKGVIIAPAGGVPSWAVSSEFANHMAKALFCESCRSVCDDDDDLRRQSYNSVCFLWGKLPGILRLKREERPKNPTLPLHLAKREIEERYPRDALRIF